MKSLIIGCIRKGLTVKFSIDPYGVEASVSKNGISGTYCGHVVNVSLILSEAIEQYNSIVAINKLSEV